jgi:hypothetical protein
MYQLKRNVASIVVLILLVQLWGCATIPTQQFEAYKNDYEKRREAESGNEELDVPDPFAFEASTVIETEPLDDVGVRMHAWNVLAQYNEVLTVVAQGHSPAEISAAVDGLTEALDEFPIEVISDVADDILPIAGVAKAALEIIEREIAAGRFIESIQAVYPEINKFLNLLESDAQNFYNIRRGLRDLDYDLLTDQINDNLFSIKAISKDFNSPVETDPEEAISKTSGLIKKVNNTLKSIPDWPEDGFLDLSQFENRKYTELAHSQFLERSNDIERLLTEAKTLDDQLLAYRDMLIQYVKMIQQTRRALKAAIKAIEQNRQPEVVAQNMFDVTIKLKRAIAEYKKAR